MKKIDKLRRTRYEISMKIIQLEAKMESGELTKNEEKEITILRKKEEELDIKIENSK